MIAYKKTNGRAHDLRLVPDDYEAQGGEILLAGTELPSLDSLHDAPTAEQIAAATQSALEGVLDAHVDATARGMGYRSSESCAGYAASTDPVFQAEALAFIAWRDDLWRTAIAIMQAVLAGQRRVPTREELLAEMPVFVRPGQ